MDISSDLNAWIDVHRIFLFRLSRSVWEKTCDENGEGVRTCLDLCASQIRRAANGDVLTRPAGIIEHLMTAVELVPGARKSVKSDLSCAPHRSSSSHESYSCLFRFGIPTDPVDRESIWLIETISQYEPDVTSIVNVEGSYPCSEVNTHLHL